MGIFGLHLIPSFHAIGLHITSALYGRVMPLVGVLDAARLELVRAQALVAVERTFARFMIIDVTGVPVLDSNVARGLNGIIATVGLLGTKVVLASIPPEVA